MEMTPIRLCDVSTCAYNHGNACHTLAITVGPHAECNSYNHGSRTGGFKEVKGGVGACLASDCRFNEQLECRATRISVENHSEHADCETFESAVEKLVTADVEEDS